MFAHAGENTELRLATLPPELLDQNALFQFMSQFGMVTQVEFKEQNKPGGAGKEMVAFVRYAAPEMAQTALTGARLWGGRNVIRVNWSLRQQRGSSAQPTVQTAQEHIPQHVRLPNTPPMLPMEQMETILPVTRSGRGGYQGKRPFNSGTRAVVPHHNAAEGPASGQISAPGGRSAWRAMGIETHPSLSAVSNAGGYSSNEPRQKPSRASVPMQLSPTVEFTPDQGRISYHHVRSIGDDAVENAPAGRPSSRPSKHTKKANVNDPDDRSAVARPASVSDDIAEKRPFSTSADRSAAMGGTKGNRAVGSTTSAVSASFVAPDRLVASYTAQLHSERWDFETDMLLPPLSVLLERCPQLALTEHDLPSPHRACMLVQVYDSEIRNCPRYESLPSLAVQRPGDRPRLTNLPPYKPYCIRPHSRSGQGKEYPPDQLRPPIVMYEALRLLSRLFQNSVAANYVADRMRMMIVEMRAQGARTSLCLIMTRLMLSYMCYYGQASGEKDLVEYLADPAILSIYHAQQDFSDVPFVPPVFLRHYVLRNYVGLYHHFLDSSIDPLHRLLALRHVEALRREAASMCKDVYERRTGQQPTIGQDEFGTAMRLDVNPENIGISVVSLLDVFSIALYFFRSGPLQAAVTHSGPAVSLKQQAAQIPVSGKNESRLAVVGTNMTDYSSLQPQEGRRLSHVQRAEKTVDAPSTGQPVELRAPGQLRERDSSHAVTSAPHVDVPSLLPRQLQPTVTYGGNSAQSVTVLCTPVPEPSAVRVPARIRKATPSETDVAEVWTARTVQRYFTRWKRMYAARGTWLRAGSSQRLRSFEDRLKLVDVQKIVPSSKCSHLLRMLHDIRQSKPTATLVPNGYLHIFSKLFPGFLFTDDPSSPFQVKVAFSEMDSDCIVPRPVQGKVLIWSIRSFGSEQMHAFSADEVDTFVVSSVDDLCGALCTAFESSLTCFASTTAAPVSRSVQPTKRSLPADDTDDGWYEEPKHRRLEAHAPLNDMPDATLEPRRNYALVPDDDLPEFVDCIGFADGPPPILHLFAETFDAALEYERHCWGGLATMITKLASSS